MDILTEDGEILQQSPSMMIALQKAEIDQQISTARAYPRQLTQVKNRIYAMALLDKESVDECIFSLPRGGKSITGASIRFAEILQQSYGNCTTGARVVHVDRKEKYVEAEGVFYDLETNSRTVKHVQRRISNKSGSLFNDDMILMTGNAACSIALRNAIMGGIPKPLWNQAFKEVEKALNGGVKTLSERRDSAFKHLSAFGVTPDQIFEHLEIDGKDDLKGEHIVTLIGIYNAIKNGEYSAENFFTQTSGGAKETPPKANPLAKKANVGKEEPSKPAVDNTKKPEEPEEKKAEKPKQQSTKEDVKPISPYNEGYKAFKSGKTQSDNPYNDVVDFGAWQEGFEQAEKGGLGA